MRLWHQALIKYLPTQQLTGQHRECCALRGLGWGKPHSTVNYVFTYSPQHLYYYHRLIIKEMENRGYAVDNLWKNPKYRGKRAESYNIISKIKINKNIYKEHNRDYLIECLLNLQEKGINLKEMIQDDKTRKAVPD